MNKKIRYCLIGFFGYSLLACSQKADNSENPQPSTQTRNNGGADDLDITSQIAKALISPKTGKGVGKFTIKGTSEVHLAIPREFLDFDPDIPNGEVEMLLFVFYLPDWISREDELQQKNSPGNRNLHHVNARISSIPKRYASGCWAGLCLGQDYATFQGEIEGFQTQENLDSERSKDVRRCLKNGALSLALGLVSYEGRASIYTQQPDVIYLEKNADPCNPGKWLYCSGHACFANQVKSGAHFQYSYRRGLLNSHQEIEKGFQKRISEFKVTDN